MEMRIPLPSNFSRTVRATLKAAFPAALLWLQSEVFCFTIGFIKIQMCIMPMKSIQLGGIVTGVSRD